MPMSDGLPTNSVSFSLPKGKTQMTNKRFPELNRRQLVAGSAALLGAAAFARTGSESTGAGAALAGRTQRPAKVAFLIDEGATIIDFCGPWEALNDASVAGVPGFELYTVATSTRPIKAEGGMKIVPDYSLTDAPQPAVIIIPAQGGARDPRKLEWLKSQHGRADLIMSVCTGAFVLARTGLLDGREATTHHLFYDQFANEFPKVKLVRNRRFIDNGGIMSAGGLTSGIDGALHVVERYYGRAAALQTAAYMEFQPRSRVEG